VCVCGEGGVGAEDSVPALQSCKLVGGKRRGSETAVDLPMPEIRESQPHSIVTVTVILILGCFFFILR
jgi:hypothetical protein